MIPLRLGIMGDNDEYVIKDLWEIFEPEVDFSQMTDSEILTYAYEHLMFPSEVKLSSETYSRNATRTANYELEDLTIVNAKSKPEFTWSHLRADYVERLLTFLGFHYDYKNAQTGEIVPEEAPVIQVTYKDFTGMRTIKAYLGQTIDGTLIEVNDVQYWESFRIAFPER